MEELVDIIGENGEVLRQAAKNEAHTHGWLHKVVIGYLRQEDNWALARQASDRQDAGQLVAPVGGHVTAGETETEALLREADEEIGTRNIVYQEIGRAVLHRQVIGRDENHLFVVYEITTEDEVKLGNESISLERFSEDKLKQSLVDHPQNFGEAYYFVLEKFYPDYLPQGWVNRWGSR